MIAVISFLLLSAVSVLDATPVVYGTDVTVVKYPFMVHLEISDSAGEKEADGSQLVSICGGTLIGLQTILTAAHCVDVEGEATIVVSAGMVHLNDKKRQRRVTKLYLKHEHYQPMVEATKDVKEKQIEHDVAIVWIIRPFIESDKIQIAELPKFDPVLRKGFTDATLIFMGWGSAETGRDEDQLKEGKANAITIAECIKKHKVEKDDKMICVEKPTKATLCFGDSGSPILYDNKPIGVASFIITDEAKQVTLPQKPGSQRTTTTTTTTTEPPAEVSCAREHVNTFMNIFPYVAWIRGKMNPPAQPRTNNKVVVNGKAVPSRVQGIPTQSNLNRGNSPNRKRGQGSPDRRSGSPRRSKSPISVS